MQPEQHQENLGVRTVLKSDAWSCFIKGSGHIRIFTGHLAYQLFYYASHIPVYHNQHLCQHNFIIDAIQQIYHLVCLS